MAVAGLRITSAKAHEPAVRALIERHLRGMLDSSPPESVHALPVDALAAPDIALFGAWVGNELAGIGALKSLGAERGELKSMRVADAHLGGGIGRAMLEHLIAAARTLGMTSLWLETGRSAEFGPALALYRSAGFVECGPFADYGPDPFSYFMTLRLV